VYLRRFGIRVVGVLKHFPSMYETAHRWEKGMVRGLIKYGLPVSLNSNVQDTIYNTVDYKWGQAGLSVGGSELKLGLPGVDMRTNRENTYSDLIREPSKMFDGVDSDEEWEEDQQRLRSDVERLQNLVWARYFGTDPSDDDLRYDLRVP